MRHFAFFAFALLFASLLQGCIIIPISLPGGAEVRQVVYRDGSGIMPKKIAIIEVSGVLNSGGSGDGFFSADSSVVDLAKKLAAVREDRRVKAVILRVDTPGGGVTASDIMYHELEAFRAETDLPVYVSMQTVAASGGYYVSMASDKIYAAPTSITGSIGVIGVFPEATGLMKMVGLKMNAIKSGAQKDGGAFYRDMDDESRAIYQAMIDDFYGKFVDVIAANRTNLEREEIVALADGRVYTAQQAVDAGLIDGIAYLDEVVEAVENDFDLAGASVVIVSRSAAQTTESLYAASMPGSRANEKPAASQVNIVNFDARSLAEPVTEPFNYLWMP
ncbi:MAG: protease [Candidatus Sumerlaeota bacterium]|nr:protease [Candidatus Sumerlaeota bacterium]